MANLLVPGIFSTNSSDVKCGIYMGPLLPYVVLVYGDGNDCNILLFTSGIGNDVIYSLPESVLCPTITTSDEVTSMSS